MFISSQENNWFLLWRTNNHAYNVVDCVWRQLFMYILLHMRVYVRARFYLHMCISVICIDFMFQHHSPTYVIFLCRDLYYNYEKYPLSPLKPGSMALIEQYLPNISDPVYSVHQSLMWFLWLNWRKSTFYPVTAPNDSKCLPIVTSSIQKPVASNCDVTMTDCSRVVAMNAFLAQWCWGQWLYFVTPVFQHGASLVYIILYQYRC